MEKMEVFGIQIMNFDSKDGKHIEGVKLHCVKEPPNQHWKGKGYEGIFVSVKSDLHKLAIELPIGAVIDVSFNRYGKPDGFTISK